MIRRPAVVVCILVLAGVGPAAGAPEEGAGAAAGLEDVRALLKSGRYAEAEEAVRPLLAQAEAGLGADSIAAADPLDLLVEALWRGGRATDPRTRPLAERAVRIRETLHGRGAMEVAASVNNLACVLYMTGDLEGAAATFRRVVEIRETALGPDHPEVAKALSNLGAALMQKGDFAAARGLYERALAIQDKTAPGSVAIGNTLHNLGNLLERAGDYEAALDYNQRALKIREANHGPDHRDVAQSLNNIGNVLVAMGEYVGARQAYERALRTTEKLYGGDHSESYEILVNIASVLQAMGDYEAAEPLFDQALATQERDRPDSVEIGNTLNNLANLHLALGEWATARQLHERAMAVRVKAPGPAHPFYGQSLNNLAEALIAEGNDTAARPLVEQALAIYRKALDPDHPWTAGSLTLLGGIARRAGETGNALAVFRESLAMRRRSLGPRHPLVGLSLMSIAEVNASIGKTEEALGQALEAEEIGRDHLRLTMEAIGERQALAYAAARTAGIDLALDLVAREPRPERVRRVWDALIRSRAVVFDEMARRHQALYSSSDPGIQKLLQARTMAGARLANLTLRGPGEDPPDRYRARLDEMRRSKEEADRTLAERSAHFRTEVARAHIGWPQVADALPRDAAVVAFAVYHPPPPSGRRDDAPAARYLAFVARGDNRSPVAVPIGAAGEIEARVLQWQEEAGHGAIRAGRSARESEQAYRAAGVALRRAVWDPIVPRLKGSRRVFVVPDGVLHLVNFAALPDGDRYLIENDPNVHLLSAERDLVASGGAGAGAGILAVGGPAFDASPGSRGPSVFRGGQSDCGDFRALRFDPLPAAAREAEEAVARWGRSGRATLLIGAEAGEAALKEMAPGRQVLHLATHGFFLDGRCAAAGGKTRGVGGLRPRETPSPDRPVVENPLLLAGLVLAGANNRNEAPPEGEDGILTAEEIAALDLSGVEWAVLSACDTGIGKVQAGEGVFGLRRAFQEAGARTVIMSLWAVEDEATRAWMSALYETRRAGGRTTAEAVREAGLTLLRARRKAGLDTHPFHWAAFVAVGDWR
jgi:CHAT domain-containing protein/Tfp pilus assembly protein PilF